jgi:hypothetical protein
MAAKLFILNVHETLMKDDTNIRASDILKNVYILAE